MMHYGKEQIRNQSNIKLEGRSGARYAQQHNTQRRRSHGTHMSKEGHKWKELRPKSKTVPGGKESLMAYVPPGSEQA